MALNMETKNNNFELSFSNSIERQVYESLSGLSVNSAATSNIDNYPIAIGTHPGNVRTRNEDRIAVAHISSCNGNNYTLAIVCDGVGGSSYGDIAASLAISYFLTEIKALNEKNDLKTTIEYVIRKIDDNVRNQLKGEGTTTISAILSDSIDFLAINIGDSRIFSWDIAKNHAKQISEDDTLENEFKRNNIKDVAALKIHNINNTLSQAIGERDRSSEQLEINCYESKYFEKGIVLATDGAWKDTGEVFLSLLKQAPSSLDAIRRVLATATWCGGRDNISMLAIEDTSALNKLAINENNESNEFNWLTIWVKNSKIRIACPVDQPSANKPKARTRNSPSKSKVKKQETKREAVTLTKDKVNYEISIEQNEEVPKGGD